MKIYTRGGDKGKTSLFSGERRDKADIRIEALGDIDELVAALGLAKVEAANSDMAVQIETLQIELYQLLAEVASTKPMGEPFPIEASQRLESMIDSLQEQLPPLTDFIIPGESFASATLHSARTICRRAERRVVEVSLSEEISDAVLAYVNRLSDLLFVLARMADNGTHGGNQTFKSKL